MKKLIAIVILALTVFSCQSKNTDKDISTSQEEFAEGKIVVYQVFTRLFGNKNTSNKPWGTIEENGVGKFDDFTHAALAGIKEFGTFRPTPACPPTWTSGRRLRYPCPTRPEGWAA